MIAPYSHVFLLAGLLFVMGAGCTVARRNLVMILLGFEIMLNAGAIAFVGAALRWQSIEGQVFALFILAVAAAEVSIGLALIICIYRRSGTVAPDRLD
ncbi:MAG: NADH-quinone oxidoreductase subunit NuoK [Desulfobacteraceae bacterium]|jgi:NADH-quinone oxidoreductase subunit K|nr:NADH-quinone oxidoreductase subunit NuoK [Desulfobacteraceae bacterium]